MGRGYRSMEIGTGLFMVLGFMGIGFLTMQLSGSGFRISRASQSYPVTARFDNIGELKVDSPVKIAGVRVGRVKSITYDTSDYKAVVALSIEQRYDRIPEDSDAAIRTSGLLGANYIGITPGGSEVYLRPGSRIEFTKSAFSIEGLVNKFMANFAGKAADPQLGKDSK
jgi:phospholipid/cholesterol/gamma-HCH transport system substrate-binding protein